jgi:nucleotide-binding universal stress UspA family protein
MHTPGSPRVRISIRRRSLAVEPISAEAKSYLAERGVDAETVEAQGDPGSAIVDAAEDAGLVIVGSRGLNPIQRLLMGSVKRA